VGEAQPVKHRADRRRTLKPPDIVGRARQDKARAALAGKATQEETEWYPGPEATGRGSQIGDDSEVALRTGNT